MNDRIKEIEERYKKEIEELKENNNWLKSEVKFFSGLANKYVEELRNKKVIIEELEYNMHRANRLNSMLKTELDKEKINNKRIQFTAATDYTDLIIDIKNKVKDIEIINIYNEETDEYEIRFYYKYEDYLHFIYEEFEDKEITVNKVTLIGSKERIDLLSYEIRENDED